MAIDRRDYLPTVGFEPLRRVIGEPAGDLAVDRDAIVVVEGDQLAELQRTGERTRLVRDAFHQAAIAEEYPGVVVDDRMPRPVELAGKQGFTQRHADRIGQPLAERPGRGLDTGGDAVLRMARRLRVQLPECDQLGHRQVVATQVQQRVQQHRSVPVRQHEPVAVRPSRIGRIMLQVMAPERFGDVGHPHRHAGMPGVGFLDCVHRKYADRVGEFGASGHGQEAAPVSAFGSGVQ